MTDKYILGYGNALLDMTISVDDAVLTQFNLTKGGMHLVDKKQSDEIIDSLLEALTTSIVYTAGGSTGNTCAQVGLLKTPVAFRGVVGEDSFGETYKHAMEKSDVETILVNTGELTTGHAITLITPDGERTFATYLGAAVTLAPDMIDVQDIQDAALIHVEGYLLEDGNSYDAILRIAEYAKQTNVPLSIDLCDASLVDRRYDALSSFVCEHAAIVFANKEELCQITKTDHFEDALVASKEVMRDDTILWAKNGAEGSVCLWGGDRYDFPVYEVDVVNTNGAGDMYAAAVLHGMAHDWSPEKIGQTASHLSGLVVSSHGARIDEVWHPELVQYQSNA